MEYNVSKCPFVVFVFGLVTTAVYGLGVGKSAGRLICR